jgi:hypothetical protein
LSRLRIVSGITTYPLEDMRVIANVFIGRSFFFSILSYFFWVDLASNGLATRYTS